MPTGMSPAPAVQTMDWPTAQHALIEGKKIRRESWSNPSICVFVADGLLKIRQATGKLDNLLVSDGDMLAEDWVVVSDN